MLIATALNHVVGEVNNVAFSMTVTAQHIFQRMVKQVGSMDVNLHHRVQHMAQRCAWRFCQPPASVMNNRAQAGAVASYRIRKSINAFISRKVCLNTDRASSLHDIDGGIVSPVA